MREWAEVDLTAGERELFERWQQAEQQLPAQANQLAEFKAVIAAQGEEIARLQETIAQLKGHPRRPPITPSPLESANPGSRAARKRRKRGQKRAGSAKRHETAQLTIDQTIIRRPERVPPGAVFQGSQAYGSQELELGVQTTRYRCERWQTPDGE
jgi:hypothetical protein